MVSVGLDFPSFFSLAPLFCVLFNYFGFRGHVVFIFWFLQVFLVFLLCFMFHYFSPGPISGRSLNDE